MPNVSQKAVTQCVCSLIMLSYGKLHYYDYEKAVEECQVDLQMPKNWPSLTSRKLFLNLFSLSLNHFKQLISICE